MSTSNGTLQTSEVFEGPTALLKNESELLIPLMPEEVERDWGMYGPLILRALPPTAQASAIRATNILRAILAEDAQVWALYDNVQEDATGDLVAVLVTTVWIDSVDGTRRLLIYSLTSLRPLREEIFWQTGTDILRKYARTSRCSHIVAYSDIPEMATFLDRRGWDVGFRLLTLEV
jgi:hypothetical protein